MTNILPHLSSKQADSLSNDGVLESSEKMKKRILPTVHVKSITLSLKISDLQRQLEA